MDTVELKAISSSSSSSVAGMQLVHVAPSSSPMMRFAVGTGTTCGSSGVVSSGVAPTAVAAAGAAVAVSGDMAPLVYSTPLLYSIYY
mmetsp:Transcript_6277/g.13704  ORF Transcript_6277/g.13704 Transcript_6277/m.13704 type:complete len:87 (-) Transcript_6277:117-377(-)